MKYGDITLKKGVFTTDNKFYDWISKISLNTYERLTVVIRLLDEQGNPKMTWTLTNAFPKQVTPTDMNSQSSEAAIETIVLVHEGLRIEAA
jgi:phage tail-like protein